MELVFPFDMMRKAGVLIFSGGQPLPLPRGELKLDERVVFFPTIGQRAQVEAIWELDVHGCVYKPETRRTLAAALRRSLGIDEDELTAEERATFRERVRLFLVDNERGKTVSIRLRNRVLPLAASEANGHFHSTLKLTADEFRELTAANTNRAQVLHFQLAAVPGQTLASHGEIHLLTESGLSVVSDVDDTIKISQVRDRKAMIRNTFVKPFQPVPGMADVYRNWAKSAGASFHYVSASPWQLYQPLSEFTRSNGFPAGSWHMKMFRVKDETALSLLSSPEQYKPDVISALLKRFPQRRFVLVGDSGEKDPEVYGSLAREYPQQIVKILIRDVTDEPPDSARYAKAFADLPRALWRIFKDSAEIEDATGYK